ncbi:alpha-E domain-containing protein [Persephonella sp.]|nr:alpha-E domain-containing protein [Aquificota bacterium]
MLSRIANNLFWLGRYLERVEDTARFIEVQYYSFLDAPFIQKEEIALNSILVMLGNPDYYFSKYDRLNEKDILYTATLDRENPVSIISSLSFVRENARTTRDILSEDLWEAINKFYLFLKNFSRKKFLKAPIELFEDIIENCYIINGIIDRIIMKDIGWAFIKLGIDIERSAQLARMILAKIESIESMEKPSKVAENFQWRTLLESAAALDINKAVNHRATDKDKVLELLTLNLKSPRSIAYNLQKIHEYLMMISPEKEEKPETPEFTAGRMASQLKYTTVEDIYREGEKEFYSRLLSEIYQLASKIEKRYFVF